MRDNGLEALKLDTDIASAAAGLDGPPAPAAFVLPSNLFHFHATKARDRTARRGIKRFIRPDNAACLLPHLPGPDDRTHCILRGDFVLCDIIPAIIAARGRCLHLRIATLGLSVANADALACLVERGAVERLTLLVSMYFAKVDKSTVFPAVTARLAGITKMGVTRTHAKVICLPAGADSFVIEGSANLRSSDNLEQMVVTNDPETHAFHAGWIDSLAT